jgi:hypothetical protein
MKIYFENFEGFFMIVQHFNEKLEQEKNVFIDDKYPVPSKIIVNNQDILDKFT